MMYLHQSSRHVHFNNSESPGGQQHGQSRDHHEVEPQEMEASCDHSPTKLFVLMSQQRWDAALQQLHRKPIEAHVWICSTYADNRHEYRWRHLPLHLACLQGPEPAPLMFIEALTNSYPEAAQCYNLEGNLPIHIACECMELGPRYGLEVEGILITLIKAFPECLVMRDSMGRRPIDILEEKGMTSFSKEHAFGRGVSIVKYMKAQERVMKERTEQQQQRTEESARHNNNNNHTKKRSRRRPRNNMNIEVPESSRVDAVTYHDEEEKIEQMDRLHASPTRYISQQPPPIIAEQHFPFSPANKSIPNADGVNSPYGNQQRPIEPRLYRPAAAVTPTSPFSPLPVAPTPHGANTLSIATEHFDPFHHLEAEMNSMRNAHQSMSTLLSAKTQSENELLERLRRIEEENAQLKNDLNNLTNEHKGTVSELQEKTRAVENCSYEVKIIKSKEKALSAELALKLQASGKQSIEIESLQSEIEKEKAARIEAMEKLEHQRTLCSNLEDTTEETTQKNEQLSKENEKLSRESKELQLQISQDSQLLEDAKAKEKTLIGLLSKMHSKEELDETVGENQEMNRELRQKSTQLKEAKMRESKLNNLLIKMKGALESTKEESDNLKSENKRLANINNDMRNQLAKNAKQLQEIQVKQMKVEQQKMKTSPSESEKLRAQNVALRATALKSIETVGFLQKRIPYQIPSSSDRSKEGLNRLLKNAESAAVLKSNIDAGESIDLLLPVVNDALNLQKDTVERAQQLLKQCHETMKLIEQVPSIPHKDFTFNSTLRVMEDTISFQVQILETLGDTSSHLCSVNNNLASLFSQQQLHENTRTTKSMNAKNQILEGGDQSKRMDLLTQKHIKKLESLSKTVAGLPQVNVLNLVSDKKDIQKHLNMVDKITGILQQVLTSLVHDAKQLKVENST